MLFEYTKIPDELHPLKNLHKVGIMKQFKNYVLSKIIFLLNQLIQFSGQNICVSVCPFLINR